MYEEIFNQIRSAGINSCILSFLNLINALWHNERRLDSIFTNALNHLIKHIEAFNSVLNDGMVLKVMERSLIPLLS